MIKTKRDLLAAHIESEKKSITKFNDKCEKLSKQLKCVSYEFKLRRNDQIHKEKTLITLEETISATKRRFVDILKTEDLYGKELNYDALRKEGHDLKKLLELKEL